MYREDGVIHAQEQARTCEDGENEADGPKRRQALICHRDAELEGERDKWYGPRW